VRRVHGEEHVERAMAAGRGVVLAVPHLACWEILGYHCSLRWPMTSLYRAPRMKELETFTRDARGRFGAHLVPAGLGATRALLRALRAGQIVAMLPDQDAGEGAGVFVPFFGIEVNTMTLVSGLAARTGAPVVLGHSVRLDRGRGFDLHFVPASPAVRDRDPLVAAAALNADIERLVRERPEQYLWSYKRFRFLPPGRPDPYRGRR
jgi:KDO2-lipid IV(A) lauroyltransferase